jgi:ABC-type Na+ transport system ATPase subunit NatA
MIEVRHLGKTFGAVPAVTGISFTASDGQITDILSA